MVEHDKIRHNDTYECAKCGKQWDIKDPEPPRCKEPQDYLAEMRSRLNTKKTSLK